MLKEGLAEDPGNREKILPLLRFASTHDASDEPAVSLRDYLARMKAGQERIYYIIADSVTAARASPYIEELKERGIEVLLLGERIDEWVMGQLDTFEGKHFKDAARGDLELGALADEADSKRQDEALKESKPLLKRVKDALGDRVTEVRISARLRESPACLVLGEQEMGASMRRILAAAGQKPPDSKPAIELNVDASAGSLSGGRGGSRTLHGGRAVALRPGGARRGQPAGQSGRVRAAPQPLADPARRRAGGTGLMRWRHVRCHPAGRVLPGPVGALEALIEAPATAAGGICRHLPSAPLLRRHARQQGRLHPLPRLSRARRCHHPIQFPRSWRERGPIRRRAGRDRRCARDGAPWSRALARRCAVAGGIFLWRRRRDPSRILRPLRRGWSQWRLQSAALTLTTSWQPECPWLLVQGDADELVEPG